MASAVKMSQSLLKGWGCGPGVGGGVGRAGHGAKGECSHNVLCSGISGARAVCPLTAGHSSPRAQTAPSGGLISGESCGPVDREGRCGQSRRPAPSVGGDWAGSVLTCKVGTVSPDQVVMRGNGHTERVGNRGEATDTIHYVLRMQKLMSSSMCLERVGDQLRCKGTITLVGLFQVKLKARGGSSPCPEGPGRTANSHAEAWR